MNDESLTELLRRFGFSDKEVDTYLTLLEHGEAKPSVIAEDADVSKRYVYSVSEELEEKGFVEVKSHVVPTTIRAYPPDDVIDDLKTDIDDMRDGLTRLYTEPEPTSDQIEVIKSRTTALKRIETYVSEAESEIALALPTNYIDRLADELRAAVDRNLLVVLIVTNVNNGATPDSYEGLASVVRTWSEVMPTILTVDSTRGVFAPTQMLLGADRDQQGIVFVQEQLSPVIFGSFFGNYWPVATEVATIDPSPLPATYTNFRNAVLQATLHTRANETLQAEVRGVETGPSGDAVELAGTVIDVTQGLIEPTNNEFPVQHSLTVETDDGTVVVGGSGAFLEDIEAQEITLSRT